MNFEFSLRGYGQLLDALAEHRYKVVTFGDVPRSADAGVCLLRHDVDASLEFATRLADVEAAKGVNSTYFVMLRSPLYNILSKQAVNDLRHLIANGHQVGLHFDNGHDEPGEGVEER